MKKSRFGLWFGVLSVAISAVSADQFENDQVADLNQTFFFISEIFDKYGNNNVMTYEGFEHLLENLGLGKLKFETKHDVSIHKVNGTFREFHDELSLHRHEHDQEEFSENDKKHSETARRKRNLIKEDKVKKNPMRKCLTAQDILATYGLKPYHEVVISPSKYLQICPAIVYELDQKLCLEEGGEIREEEKDRHLVWIYASVSILVIGVSGMICVLLVPLVRRDYFSSFLQFLVSLATGTLCGDALIHLIPQIFSTEGQPGSQMVMIFRGTVTLSAIYFFFTIEHVLKGLRGKKSRSSEDNKELGTMLQPFENHGHCHGSDLDGIKTVAWMAIMGDILHNFTDGLSIGAAFGMSLSSGFASSIAIFFHELPHELGDCAILLASGMTVRKSLFYNVLSTVFSLIGMIAGVLLGEIQNASLWINAFTAGSFLYIALSDLVPEMKLTQKNSSYKHLLLQATGLLCGGILMLTVALYEDQLESLLC